MKISVTLLHLYVSTSCIESSTPESVQNLSSVTPSQKISTATRDGSRSVEPDLGSIQFVSLVNVKEEENTLDSDNKTDLMKHITLSGKRILRERPAKPSKNLKKCIDNPQIVEEEIFAIF